MKLTLFSIFCSTLTVLAAPKPGKCVHRVPAAPKQTVSYTEPIEQVNKESPLLIPADSQSKPARPVLTAPVVPNKRPNTVSAPVASVPPTASNPLPATGGPDTRSKPAPFSVSAPPVTLPVSGSIGPLGSLRGNSGPGNCKVALFADSTFASLKLGIADIMKRVSGMFQSDLGFGLQTLEFIDADGAIFDTSDEIARSFDMSGEADAFLAKQGFSQGDFCSKLILTKRVLTIGNGYGSIGSMCNGGFAVASTMGKERDLDLAGIARVIAHEMGHNFGARHGSIGKHFIMNPQSRLGTLDKFSGSSIGQMQAIMRSNLRQECVTAGTLTLGGIPVKETGTRKVIRLVAPDVKLSRREVRRYEYEV